MSEPLDFYQYNPKLNLLKTLLTHGDFKKYGSKKTRIQLQLEKLKKDNPLGFELLSENHFRKDRETALGKKIITIIENQNNLAYLKTYLSDEHWFQSLLTATLLKHVRWRKGSNKYTDIDVIGAALWLEKIAKFKKNDIYQFLAENLNEPGATTPSASRPASGNLPLSKGAEAIRKYIEQYSPEWENFSPISGSLQSEIATG